MGGKRDLGMGMGGKRDAWDGDGWQERCREGDLVCISYLHLATETSHCPWGIDMQSQGLPRFEKMI